LRILIFNWRDIENPRSGGAEVFTHEIARRWVDRGHRVSMVVSAFPGSVPRCTLDGIDIHRAGNHVTVYPHANRIYKKHLEGRVDLVVEGSNGLIPWYCRYYVREPLVGLRHHFGRDHSKWDFPNSVSRHMFPPPLNFFIYSAEPHIFRYYTRFPVMVVSESTRKDLLDLGATPEHVRVVSEGIDVKPVPRPSKKQGPPSFIFVSRLVRDKRVDHAIRAMQPVVKRHSDARLRVVGRGPDHQDRWLRALVKELGLEDHVSFEGFVSQERKYELLRRSHCLVITSIREGWGLVVTEANAMGTVAVGYDVPGVRDSIQDGKTGLLVPSGDVSALGDAMIRMIEDEDMRDGLARAGWEWSKSLNWDRAADVTMDAATDLVQSYYGVSLKC